MKINQGIPKLYPYPKDGEVVSIEYISNDGQELNNKQYNLIEAAPYLLMALEDAILYLELGGDKIMVLDAARRAIAKANGEDEN